MTIYVTRKHAGNLAKKIKETPFVLSKTPRTLRELIAELVLICIQEDCARAQQSETPQPLSAEQLAEMREIGKFAFGVHYNQTEPDPERAFQTALEAVEDGLVRVFRGRDELTALDDPVSISDGDVFTFVRLTMLSGRLW